MQLQAIRRSMPDLLGWPLSGASEVPCLFIHGGNSHYLSESGRDAARRSFPQAEFLSIDGAGHWVQQEQPDAVSSLLVDFLRQPTG